MSNATTTRGRTALRRNDTEDRNLHLSPILQQIRDDGPAVAALAAPAAPAALAVASAGAMPPAPATVAAMAPAATPDLQAALLAAGFRFQNMFWYLLVTCLLLTIALSCTVVYSYRQQAQIIEMQARLESLAPQGALAQPIAQAP